MHTTTRRRSPYPDSDAPAYWRHDVLTEAQERALARRAKEGDKAARDELVLKNQRLVILFARRWRSGCSLSLEDRVSAGNKGLLHAIDLYDPDRERLTTYAGRWIRQAIRREIQETGHVVRIPCYLAELVDQYRRLRRRMRVAKGSDPSFDDVCDRLGVLPSRRKYLRAALNTSAAEYLPIMPEDARWTPDVDSDGTDVSPARITTALSQIDAGDARAIRLYYGLGSHDGQGRTMVQVAAAEGQSYQWIQQRLRRGMRQLQELISSPSQASA